MQAFKDLGADHNWTSSLVPVHALYPLAVEFALILEIFLKGRQRRSSLHEQLS